MGRFGSPQIGYLRDNDDNDIPELNKCPDCGAFFDGDICPICKKVCPEEMKAGNRRPPKKRKKREKSNYRSVPTDLYHQTWFIIIALFISRLVGIILVWTSDWKKWVKVVVTVIALFGVYICYAVGMVIFGGINGNPDGAGRRSICTIPPIPNRKRIISRSADRSHTPSSCATVPEMPAPISKANTPLSS